MLTKHLNDPEFIARHRTKASAFVRDRRLPFHRLCLILIWNLRSALHLDLERFFDQADNTEAPHPTAFSKARAFLTRNVSKVDYSVQSVGGGGLEHREG